MINNDSKYSARRPRGVFSIGDLWTGSILVSEDGQRLGLIEFAGDWGPVIEHIYSSGERMVASLQLPWETSKWARVGESHCEIFC